MRTIFRLLILASMGVLLAACASTVPNANINIQSARYLNPDINGRASPVVVSIYQLKSPFSFKNANYSALSANSAQVLGSDLVDKQTVEVRPDSQKIINLSLAQNTKYIGIVAGYRKINQASWHRIIRVPAKDKRVSVAVVLESQGLAAHLQQQKGFF